MGTTYKGIYIPAAGEDNWDVAVNANWTRIADRDELIRKSADEALVSNTTLQNDDHLVYTMTANHTWAFRLVLLATSATANLKANFTVPASASWSLIYIGPSTTTGTRNSSGAATDIIVAGLATYALPTVFDGIVTCGSGPGNFQLQWAQNSSSANAVTVLTNSYLLMKLLV